MNLFGFNLWSFVPSVQSEQILTETNDSLLQNFYLENYNAYAVLDTLNSNQGEYEGVNLFTTFIQFEFKDTLYPSHYVVEISSSSDGGMTYFYNTSFSDTQISAYQISETNQVIIPLAPLLFSNSYRISVQVVLSDGSMDETLFKIIEL